MAEQLCSRLCLLMAWLEAATMHGWIIMHGWIPQHHSAVAAAGRILMNAGLC
jgi:hypothetical protein